MHNSIENRDKKTPFLHQILWPYSIQNEEYEQQLVLPESL